MKNPWKIAFFGVVLILISLLVGYYLGNNKSSGPIAFPIPTYSLYPTSEVLPTHNPTYPSPAKNQTCCNDLEKKLGYECVYAACTPSILSYEDNPDLYRCISAKDAIEFHKNYHCNLECLSSLTEIFTSQGDVIIKNLKVGDLVWTLNKEGKKELQPIVKLSRVAVPKTHQMSHLVFIDGRELYVSPGHPTTDGKTVGILKVGDKYDNSIVKSNKFVSYWDSYTYDLLPAGDTGFYFANGILMGSTLK